MNTKIVKNKSFTSLTKKNPCRYIGIKPVVDSGINVKKLAEMTLQQNKHFRMHQEEIFQRVTLKSIISLLLETCYLSKVIFESDIMDNSSYLLLDVRDPLKYKEEHIISAVNYPLSRLNRTINSESSLLLKYKNYPGHVIFVYDDDELISIQFITILVQRGYENIFLLSGGLNLTKLRFPESLIVRGNKKTLNEKDMLVIESYLSKCPSIFNATPYKLTQDGSKNVSVKHNSLYIFDFVFPMPVKLFT